MNYKQAPDEMEVTDEIESHIVDTLRKIRLFDESIRQLRQLGATVGAAESERVRNELDNELAKLTKQISANPVR